MIIPAFNAEATLAEQLEALTHQTYDGQWEVIVADNRSNDGTRRVIDAFRDRLPNLAVADATAKQGAGYARNVAASLASGDLLAMCDADDVVAPDWLAALVTAATTKDIVGGSQRRLDSTQRADSEPEPNRLPRPFGYLPVAASGNCAVWIDAFKALEGFDESLKNAEDWDLSWRAQKAGYTIGVAPDAVIFRRARGSLVGLARQSYNYGRGTAELARRHPQVIDTSVRSQFGRWLKILVRAPYVALPGPRQRALVRGFAYSAGFTLGTVDHAHERES